MYNYILFYDIRPVSLAVVFFTRKDVLCWLPRLASFFSIIEHGMASGRERMMNSYTAVVELSMPLTKCHTYVTCSRKISRHSFLYSELSWGFIRFLLIMFFSFLGLLVLMRTSSQINHVFIFVYSIKIYFCCYCCCCCCCSSCKNNSKSISNKSSSRRKQARHEQIVMVVAILLLNLKTSIGSLIFLILDAFN